MSNPLDSTTINLFGKDRELTPTFKSLVRIEKELGVKLLTLMRGMAIGDFGLNDAAVIIHHGLQGDEKAPPYTVEQIGIEIVGRLGKFMPVIANFLSSAVTAKPENDGGASSGN